MKGSPVRVRASALVGALKLATAFLAPVRQERLGGLEPLQAITAEISRGLREVDQVRAHVHRQLGGAEIEQKFSGYRVSVGAPCSENVCSGDWMRRRRRMSASDREMARRWALPSVQGAELRAVPAVAVAAGCPPLLLQPAAAKASTAMASVRAPAAHGGSLPAGRANRDILAELSLGAPAPARPGSR